MFTRFLTASVLAVSLVAAVSGCAVTRGQESVGAYVDDTAVTTAIKAKFAENRAVDMSMIKVETLKGTVLLSGFAKSGNEKATAESLARATNGVREVRNEIAVRP